jgi:imidazolonepropionase
VKADLLIRGISQLATPSVAGPVHGAAMRELCVTGRAAFAIADGLICWVGEEAQWRGEAEQSVDCGDRAVTPALIDPHTHAVWMGDRLADFEARACGVSYEQILQRGGGIRSTIRKTAAATRAELAAAARPRIQALVRSGAATIEVKSGYGFTAEAELRMLEAVADVAAETSARLIATLLIHIPPENAGEREGYLEEVRSFLIPEAARRRLARAVDVFVEKEAWSAGEAATLIRCARAHGLGAKLHTEQFHNVGGLELGIRENVLSVDHLEACRTEQCSLLAGASSVATILPGVTLHLGIPAAPGRELIDGGAAVAVGTDLNPGSSPLYSMASALALAVRLNGLSPSEALTAGTVNAAAALGLNDCGRLEAGCRADFLVMESVDWRELVYALGCNPVREVWIAAKRVEG